jgi:hypothetical protein
MSPHPVVLNLRLLPKEPEVQAGTVRRLGFNLSEARCISWFHSVPYLC